MTKLDTVRALNDYQPQLQIVSSVKALQKTALELQQGLQSLPDALATHLSHTIEPLLAISSDVQKAIAAYDEITAAQRAAIDLTVSQITQQATEKIAAQAKRIERAADTLLKIESAAQNIETQTSALKRATREMIEATREVKTPWYWQAVMLIAAGIVSAVTAVTGQSALSALVPPSETQRKAELLDKILAKATDQERRALQAILNR